MGGLPIYKQCFGQTLRYLSVFTKRKGMSSFDLSEEYELRQMTCWTFKWKIQQAMKAAAYILLKVRCMLMSIYRRMQISLPMNETAIFR